MYVGISSIYNLYHFPAWLELSELPEEQDAGSLAFEGGQQQDASEGATGIKPISTSMVK